jgi:hypothetical protein
LFKFLFLLDVAIGGSVESIRGEVLIGQFGSVARKRIGQVGEILIRSLTEKEEIFEELKNS